MEFLPQTEEYLRFKSENFVSSGPKLESNSSGLAERVPTERIE